MLEINFVPFPVLETERLFLRRPEISDADALLPYRSDREYMKYIMHRYTTSKKEIEQSLALMNSKIDSGEGINWSMVSKETNELTGLVGYVKFYKEHYRAEVGYMLFTPYQEKGLMREAVKAVLDFGFNQLRLHSVEAIVNHENEASKNLLEKTGFTKDAFFKDYLYQNGKFVSAHVYSLVK